MHCPTQSMCAVKINHYLQASPKPSIFTILSRDKLYVNIYHASFYILNTGYNVAKYDYICVQSIRELRGIPRLGMWIRLGIAVCRIPKSGHCDLDL